MKSWFLLGAVAVTALAIPSQAQTVRGAVAISSPQGSSSTSPLENIINQSGLSASYVNGTTNFSTFTSAATALGNGATSGAIATVSSAPILTFDLGASYQIDRIAVWSFNTVGNISVFELYTDTDSDFSNGTGALLGTFSAPAGGVRTAAVSSFGAVTTQYFQVRGTDFSGAGSSYAGGWGEVAFEQVGAATPEPASWAMMIAGFGIIGQALRRRRRAAARALTAR